MKPGEYQIKIIVFDINLIMKRSHKHLEIPFNSQELILTIFPFFLYF